MQPKIERIQACVTDPSKQASHIDRATGSVMAHDQVDTYTTEFQADPLGKLQEAARRVFGATAICLAEQCVEAAAKEFAKIAKEQSNKASELLASKDESERRKGSDIMQEIEAKQEEFDTVVASLKPEQVAERFAEGFAGDIAHVRFDDFIPVPAPVIIAHDEKKPEGGEEAPKA